MAKFVISIEQKGTGKDTLIEKQTSYTILTYTYHFHQVLCKIFLNLGFLHFKDVSWRNVGKEILLYIILRVLKYNNICNRYSRSHKDRVICCRSFQGFSKTPIAVQRPGCSNYIYFPDVGTLRQFECKSGVAKWLNEYIKVSSVS